MTDCSEVSHPLFIRPADYITNANAALRTSLASWFTTFNHRHVSLIIRYFVDVGSNPELDQSVLHVRFIPYPDPPGSQLHRLEPRICSDVCEARSIKAERRP
jgi:hypothetical protein